MNPAFFLRDSEAVRKAASNWIARRDAGLSASEESEFAAWRDASPAHAQAIARYEKIWSQLDRPRESGAASQLNRDLTFLATHARRRRGRLTGAAVALIAIAAVVTWALRWRETAPATERSPMAVILPEHRVLSDGTIVEFPAGSAIAVDFSSPEFRRVTLVRGEAHFQVAKNPARPFIVRADGFEVRAVGTAFSVELGRASVDVVVTEGRVAVGSVKSDVTSSVSAPASPVAPTLPGATLVDAGYKFSVASETAAASTPRQVEPITPAEIDRRLAWRNPRMEFSNAPLREVVIAINRYAAERGGTQFTIADRAIEATRLSGIFRVDDASAFVGILEKGFSIEAERTGEQTIVLRQGR